MDDADADMAYYEEAAEQVSKRKKARAEARCCN